ncbi:MAG: endonuclease/exonuclease/phosphatase family protein, partial [Planctomycetota bacterium]
MARGKKRVAGAWTGAVGALVLVVAGAYLGPDFLSSLGDDARDGSAGGSTAASTGTATPPGSGSEPRDSGGIFADLDAEPDGGPTFGLHRFGLEEPLPKPTNAIRLTTYNVENFFDGVDDPVSPRHDVEWEKDSAHVEAVAKAIRKVDADVLCLQEMESEDVLRAFRDAYLSDMGYDHLVSIDAGDQRGIEQSVLSRFPIVKTDLFENYDTGAVHPELWNGRPNRYAGEPILLRRSPLFATIAVPAGFGRPEPYELTVIVVHHKSGRGNDYWREAESKGLMELIEKHYSGRDKNIAILGDFNARPDDTSVTMYGGAGFRDVWTDRPRGDWGKTHESGRAIDLILVNEALRAEVIPGSEFV